MANATARWVLPQPGWPGNRMGRLVGDEFGVDAGLELEVEVLDGLVERELRVAQPSCEAPVAGVDGLFVEEPGQELDVGPAVGAGVLGEGGEDLGGAV